MLSGLLSVLIFFFVLLRIYHTLFITFLTFFIFPFLSFSLCPGHSGHPRFNPRSGGSPQIPFPLARPKSNNIQAICRYSKQRPRYPKESLPRSGFGYLHRQANAINQLESWLSVCCRNGNEDEELTLCCAEQAVRTWFCS